MPSLTEPVLARGTLARLTQPTLTVDELVLRPWSSSDVPTIVAAFADPGIRRWHVRSMNETEANAWVAQWSAHWSAESDASWAISSEDRVLGQVGLHRLELSHSTANAASCRVAVRAGYLLEGTKRSEGLHADGWHDMHLHARLTGDGPLA